MNVVIFAGGFGTRLGEETGIRPKPMVEIGGRPLLLHLMAHYAHHGFADFTIACGWKGEVIKQYFRDFSLQHSDFVVQLKDGRVERIDPPRVD